jgi:hypothetical protein
MARQKQHADPGRPALGVDIGGVLIRPAREGGDTSFFSSGYLDTPMVDGAFDAIARLNAGVFAERVYLVSKAKSGTARKTIEWLAHHRFHDATGVPLERVRFCEERAEKAIIAKRLNLAAFVDDRIDVLRYLAGVETRVLFAAAPAFVPEEAPPPGVRLAVGWTEVLTLLKQA